jgi:hypothetical protein
MSRIVLFLLLSVAVASTAQAQMSGTFSILRLDPSPRAAAMAGSYGTAPANDVHAMFYNPAALSDELAGRLGLVYLNHIGDLNAGFTAYAWELDGVGTVAGGLRFLSWGSTDRIGEDGVEDGTFGATDLAVTLALGREYAKNIRVGAAIHGISSGIDSHRASALAADLGATLEYGGIVAGLSVHNLGIVTSSLGVEEDLLPTDLRLTVSGRLQHLPLLLSVTGRNLQDPGRGPDNLDGFDAVMRHLALGGEFQFSDAFQIRFGYNHQRHQDLKMSTRLDMAGVGLGFGLRVNRFHLDYAFNSWSTLGSLHQIGVSTRI